MLTLHMTDAAAERLMQDLWFSAFVTRSLRRFVRGDWGDTHPDDAKLNDTRLKTKEGQVAAKYADVKGTEILITKDADAMTIMLPNEYSP